MVISNLYHLLSLFHRILFFHCWAYSHIPNTKNFLFKTYSAHSFWDQFPGIVVYNHCLHLLINTLLDIFSNLLCIYHYKDTAIGRLPLPFEDCQQCFVKIVDNHWVIKFAHPYSSKLSAILFFSNTQLFLLLVSFSFFWFICWLLCFLQLQQLVSPQTLKSLVFHKETFIQYVTPLVSYLCTRISNFLKNNELLCPRTH